MNYYYVDLIDEPHTSWVMMEVVKNLPKYPRKPELPSAFYRFFQFPDAQVRLKPQYTHLYCQKCGRYDADRVFDVGFSEPATIRLKWEFGFTNDRVFIINENVLRVLKRAKVGGYETKPIGCTGWHALRASVLVDSVSSKWERKAKRCSKCGLSDDVGLSFDYLNQLSLPSQVNTFFTTKKFWPAASSHDRDLFLTEDVVNALKAGKIKGPWCTRLWTEEEEAEIKAKARQGIKSWKPPKSTVFLSGK
jgi:hypothetical protein